MIVSPLECIAARLIEFIESVHHVNLYSDSADNVTSNPCSLSRHHPSPKWYRYSVKSYNIVGMMASECNRNICGIGVPRTNSGKTLGGHDARTLEIVQRSYDTYPADGH